MSSSEVDDSMFTSVNNLVNMKSFYRYVLI